LNPSKIGSSIALLREILPSPQELMDDEQQFNTACFNYRS